MVFYVCFRSPLKALPRPQGYSLTWRRKRYIGNTSVRLRVPPFRCAFVQIFNLCGFAKTVLSLFLSHQLTPLIRQAIAAALTDADFSGSTIATTTTQSISSSPRSRNSASSHPASVSLLALSLPRVSVSSIPGPVSFKFITMDT